MKKVRDKNIKIRYLSDYADTSYYISIRKHNELIKEQAKEIFDDIEVKVFGTIKDENRDLVDYVDWEEFNKLKQKHTRKDK